MVADCVVAALEAEDASDPDQRHAALEAFDKLLVDPSIARRIIEKTRPFVDGVKL
jgi:hypothetical protein